MAGNFKHLGHRILVTYGGTVVSGRPCVQGTFFGIPMTSQVNTETGMLGISGVWNIPVPASTVAGDLLYVPSSAGGVLLTANVDVTSTLTRTSSNANAPVCVAITARDSAGNADVLILPRAAARAGTQV